MTSMRVSSTPLIANSLIVGVPGLGVEGINIPSTGENGPSVLWQYVTLPVDNDAEFRWLITSQSGLNSLEAFEDGSFIAYLDTTGTINYGAYKDGILIENSVVNLSVSSGITITPDSGTYTLTGTSNNLVSDYNTSLNAGSFSLSGQALGLTVGNKLITDSGSYSLTGDSVQVRAAYNAITETGTYNLTGQDVTLTYTPVGAGESITINSGSFGLIGTSNSLKATYTQSLNNGSYTVTGQDLTLSRGYVTILGSGTHLLTGTSLSFSQNYSVVAGSANYTLTGYSVRLDYSGDIKQVIGNVTASYKDSGISVDYKPTSITVRFN